MALLAAIVRWSLANRAVVLVSVLVFVALGVKSACDLPIDAVPDVTNIQVQVITSSPALSPVEVEQYVTVPVERALSGTPKVTEMRSLSKYGLSVVTVVFADDTDIHLARQLILERMPEAQGAIPERFGRPTMGPISTALGEIYQFTVRGEGYSLMQLEETLDWYIAPQLRQVPGVVEVNSLGGEDKQYQIIVDPDRMQANGLSVAEIAEAIRRTNGNAGGGYIERNREQLVIGTDGMVKGLEDLKTVVVGTTHAGAPITLAKVADIHLGARLRRGASSMDGKGEVVVGTALMLMGENSRTVTDAARAKLAELGPSLPKGMRIEPFYDRGALVTRTIGTVARNLAEGAALVVTVLLLLLGDLRAGLIVSAIIPLAMLFAVVLMRAVGLSGNLMSLGAIDFGLIVDGAVIIVENSVRALAARRRVEGRALGGAERSAVVQSASLEVLAASAYGGAIIAIVYVPILALRGIEGKLFHPMATTVLFALIGAFLFSLTVVPVLCSLFLKPSTRAHDTWLMRTADALYRPALRTVIRFRKVTALVGVALLAAGLLVFTRLGAEFVPQLDEGDVLVEVRRLPGISLSESIATDKRIQMALLEIPEVAHVISKTGAPELATDPMGIEQTDTYIQLRPVETWRPDLGKADIGRQIARALEVAVPEVATALSQPIQMRTNELIAGVRSDVAAQIYGPDLDTLQRLADEVGATLEKVPGATDVRIEQGSGLAYLRIRPDRAKLARYGLTVEDVNTVVEATSVGHAAGVVFEGDRRFGMVVKIGGLEGSLEGFRALPLKSASGTMVPLGDVADVSITKGPAVVNRDKQSRRRVVEFNARGRDLISVVNDAQSAVARAVKLPTGYHVEWGGQFENFISARQRLLVVVPLALALILFLLWMALGAMKPAILIFVNIPFATVGGAFALALRGLPFSISAGVGFIALFGVAVLNGLVLVSFCRGLEGQGDPPQAAIARAAEMRLRPVLMTALVAALGFVPMAISSTPGSEVQRPLATVVIGGLVTATALTLLIFPAVYSLAHRSRVRSGAEARPS